MSGQVFAVASGKGGVGKTTTVVNLGVTIRAEDHSVALVDADLGMANLATVLGIEHEPTIHDVLAGRAAIEDATVEQADRFVVVPGSRDLHGFADADPNRLRGIIDSLAEAHDYVIIDTGAGLSHEDLLPLGLADQVLLITTPDPSSVGDTRKVAGFSDILGKSVRGLVVTKSRSESDAQAAADEFDTELLAAIPEDPTVVESTAKGVPLEVYDSDSPAAAAYRQLAKKVTGEEVTADDMPEALEEPTSPGATEDPVSEPTGEPEPEPAPDTAGQPASSPESETEASDAGAHEPEPEAEAASSSAPDAADAQHGVEGAGDEANEADPEPAGDSPEGKQVAEDETVDEQPEAGEPPGDAADPAAGDHEAEGGQADDAAEDDSEEEQSTGFFGRLFGVFR